MGRKIRVNPAELTTASTQIDSAAAEYRKLFNQLYSDVSAMKAAWQGVDNQAFCGQIEGFREDFEMMAKLMDEYSAFLKQAAKTYTDAQQEVMSQARRLAT